MNFGLTSLMTLVAPMEHYNNRSYNSGYDLIKPLSDEDDEYDKIRAIDAQREEDEYLEKRREEERYEDERREEEFRENVTLITAYQAAFLIDEYGYTYEDLFDK